MQPTLILPVLAALAVTTPAMANTFAQMDSNRNGTVSSSEYQAYAEASFNRIDGNRDGQLSTEEIHHFVGIGGGKAAGPSALGAATRIQRRDLNGDGKVSRAEYAQAATSRFQELDADKNNELTERELAAGY
jgi:hypothetical protein